MSWSSQSTSVITITKHTFTHFPARFSSAVAVLRVLCRKAYLLIGDVNTFREIFIGLLTIQEWLWTGASGIQKDREGRRESLARKQGLWLEGVKPVLTGLPDGRSCPGPPWHLLPWKEAEKAWDWQGTPRKKADVGITVIAAGWGIGPSFQPHYPPVRPAFAVLQRSKTVGERELRFTRQLLEHAWRPLSILYPSRWPCICLAREMAGPGTEGEAVRDAHDRHLPSPRKNYEVLGSPAIQPAAFLLEVGNTF